MPLQRLLAPFVEIRKDEVYTTLLMFTYAFLAMTAYNIIQPLTRSKLISSLGAVNVPWVVFGSGLLIGIIMLGYTRLVSILPSGVEANVSRALAASSNRFFSTTNDLSRSTRRFNTAASCALRAAATAALSRRSAAANCESRTASLTFGSKPSAVVLQIGRA